MQFMLKRLLLIILSANKIYTDKNLFLNIFMVLGFNLKLPYGLSYYYD